MGITAKELASILGVSRATISMVYNNKGSISEETKSLVLRGAKQYGYEFSKRQKVHVPPAVISYVIFTKHGNVVSDTDFFSHVLLGIDREVRRLGYTLQVSYFGSRHQTELQQQLNAILQARPSGLILLATEMNKEDIEFFKALNIPLVVLDNGCDFDHSDCVIISNAKGAYNATKYLVEMGHRHIGHLSSKVHIKNFDERAEGFRAAVREAAQEQDIQSSIIEVGSTAETAYEDMHSYLCHTQKPQLPTAFFADNDIIASSCMKALRDHGFRIPDEVSIIGFDDMPFCVMLDPPLSTMRVTKESLGRAAVALLDSHLQNPPENRIKIEISPEFVARSSVKNVGAASNGKE